MQIIKTNKGEFLFVEVPEGKHSEWEIFDIDGGMYLNGIDDEGEMVLMKTPLPPGSFKFLSTTKDITEEQIGEVCDLFYEDTDGVYVNYYIHPSVSTMLFATATESLRSLMTANKLDCTKVYAILKRL